MIEGVPEGWELVRIGKPKIGDCFIQSNGIVTDAVIMFECESYPIVRKIEPIKVTRPMTREEFLAAWKQRGFCPLNRPDGYAVTVSHVHPAASLPVLLGNDSWHSFKSLAEDYRFASDDSPLTIAEEADKA